MSAPPPYTENVADDPSKAGYPPSQAPYPAQYPPQPAYPQQPYPQQPVSAQPVASGGQQCQQSTVVVMAPAIAVGENLGTVPVSTTCVNCQRPVVTNVSYETGGLTWLIFAILCFVGCWLCACIPFCVDDCKDVIHTCPSCGFMLGRHRRL